MTDEKTLEILKKYDPDYYEYITKNAWNFGTGTKLYAQHLQAKHEEAKDGGHQNVDRQM